MDEAILAATRALLARHGYAGLTVDAVAEHAGIGKAAIYRRYATKQEMVFAAAVHRSDLAPPPDTGSLPGDLTRLVEDIVATLGNPAASSAVLGLLADLGAPSPLADRFHASFVTGQRAVVAELMDRAVARGELGALPDVDLVHALLAGPVFATLYLQRRRPDGLAERLGRMVADTLRLEDQAVGPGGSATGSATA